MPVVASGALVEMTGPGDAVAGGQLRRGRRAGEGDHARGAAWHGGRRAVPAALMPRGALPDAGVAVLQPETLYAMPALFSALLESMPGPFN